VLEAVYDFGDMRAVVYLTSWAQYRTNGSGEWKDPASGIITKYNRPDWCADFATTPGNFDPYLATHLVYGFFIISAEGGVHKVIRALLDSNTCPTPRKQVACQ
jgi:hypothetical protein